MQLLTKVSFWSKFNLIAKCKICKMRQVFFDKNANFLFSIEIVRYDGKVTKVFCVSNYAFSRVNGLLEDI